MSTQAHETEFDVRAAPPPVEWRSWPLVERRGYIAGVAAVLLLTIVIVWSQTGSVVGCVVAGAVMALSLWRWLMPVDFELSANGLTEQSLGRRRRIPWISIRGYELLSNGVVITAMTDPVPLDSLRSLYLPWGPHRDEVVAQFRYYLGSTGFGK
jgi:hypothetical protein